MFSVVSGDEKECSLHNELDHNDEPSGRKIPVEPIQVSPSSADDSAGAVVLPQSPEAYDVL